MTRNYYHDNGFRYHDNGFRYHDNAQRYHDNAKPMINHWFKQLCRNVAPYGRAPRGGKVIIPYELATFSGAMLFRIGIATNEDGLVITLTVIMITVPLSRQCIRYHDEGTVIMITKPLSRERVCYHDNDFVIMITESLS